MKTATTFNDYFEEIVPSLNLFEWPGNFTSLANNLDTTDSIVLKFSNHPRIKMIKNKFRKIKKFSRQALKDINWINPQVAISQLIL